VPQAQYRATSQPCYVFSRPYAHILPPPTNWETLDRFCGLSFVYRVVKLKICILGLISLFAWNAVFGAFGGLLLCIHQDLGVHVDDDAVHAADGVSCADAHEETSETTSCVEFHEPCVDIELVAELLPATRLNSGASDLLPQFFVVVLIDYFRVPEPSLALVFESVAPRAPSYTFWLTDFYLQTIVLQV